MKESRREPEVHTIRKIEEHLVKLGPWVVKQKAKTTDWRRCGTIYGGKAFCYAYCIISNWNRGSCMQIEELQPEDLGRKALLAKP